jgi:hypothetical protein
VAVDPRLAGCCAGRRLVVAVEAALATLDSGDCLAGVLPGGPLTGLVRDWTQRLLGVGDLVAAAVVLDGGGGLSPGPPASDAVGHRAELAAQVAGPFLFQSEAAGPALPGQPPSDLAVGRT